MGEASSSSDPTLPPDSGDSDATRIDSGREPAVQPWPATQVQSAHPPTYAQSRQPGTEPPQQQVPDAAPRQPQADAPHQPATIMMPRQPQAGVVPREPVPYEPVPYEPAPREPGTQASPREPPAPQELVRYGPGVPVSQAGVAAESVWRTGRRAEPPPRPPGQRRLRRLLGLALTVILLLAAAVVLYLRFFDHPSLSVTSVKITQQTKTGCTVDVTGEIATNGAAGTVSYQWVFRPQTQAPQPLNQSVVSGQHAVFVTVAVEGQGHGTASQLVTLEVLGPGTGTAPTTVTLSC